VNTGLDVAPGTLVQLSAKGQVDVGWGWGVWGPEGTMRHAGGPTYPSNDGPIRYGLVARLTASRTSPEDSLHVDWSYGETRQYCAEQGGRLWLTVNDDAADNNTGAFMVRVEQTACHGQSERGRFRVTLTGFLVSNATTENQLSIDGAGDEVFALVNFAELTSSNTIVGGVRVGKSLLYGDTAGRANPFGVGYILGGQPTVLHAGSASPTGGLRNPDHIGLGGELPACPPNASAETCARLIPMVLWEGELRRGGPNPNGVVILPTIWENDNVPDEMLNVWNGSGASNFIRRFARDDSARFITGRVPRPLVEQVAADMMVMPTPQRNDFDRPIGLNGEPFNPFAAIPDRTTFIPAVMLLTFNSAQEAADSVTQGRGIVEIHYRDGERYGRGIYTIFLRVDRLP
jgi:hypothetical protein